MFELDETDNFLYSHKFREIITNCNWNNDTLAIRFKNELQVSFTSIVQQNLFMRAYVNRSPLNHSFY